MKQRVCAICSLKYGHPRIIVIVTPYGFCFFKFGNCNTLISAILPRKDRNHYYSLNLFALETKGVTAS